MSLTDRLLVFEAGDAPVQRPPPEPPRTVVMSQWQLIARAFSRHKLAVIALNVLILLYVIAIFAEFFAPYSTKRRDLDHPYCPPQLPKWSWSAGLHCDAMQLVVDPVTLRKSFVQRSDCPIPLRLFAQGDSYSLLGLIPGTRHLFSIDPSTKLSDGLSPTFFFLGADRYGHDTLSRIIFGARVSLSVGLVGVVMTFLLGITVGGVSGYIGGRVDLIIMRCIEVISSFPQLPLWIALGAILPQDWSALKVYFAITCALALLAWTDLARVVRGRMLALREEDYAMAARLLGASHTRIIARHLLPGFASHIIVALSLSVPGMILAETSLSFLGLGLRAPIVSWGVMLQDCTDIQAVRYYPWLLLPVLFIVTAVLSFNFVGDGLRDAADPYSSR